MESVTLKPEIASLYLEVMQDIFKNNDGDRAVEIARLEREIKEKKEMITKAGMKLVSDDLDKSTFEKIKSQLELEVNQATRTIVELKLTDGDFTKYCRYGFSLLANLNAVYQESDLNIKQKLISSIFPEKLEFSKGNCRTKNPSAVYTLLCSVDAASMGSEKKPAAKKSGQSAWVVPGRIELPSKV